MTIGMKTVSIKTILASAAVALGLITAAAPAMAAGAAAHPRSGGFSFEGPFGTYDQGQLQRGYKVYHEVWTWKEVFAHFLEESGKHFDPCLVDILLENKEDFIAIWEEYNDVCGVCAESRPAVQGGPDRLA